MTDLRPLTRSELAEFLPSPRAIKAFEKLFSLIPADLIELFAQIDEVSTEAGSANAQANEALAQLVRVADALELLSSKPSIRNDTFLQGDYIDFPFGGPHIQKERRIQWNNDDGTLDVGLYGGSVLQVGQETMYYAKNTAGSNLTNGTPVMFNGTIGASAKLTFEKAVADGTYPSDYMMGVTTQDIDNNEYGYVTSFGKVRGLRTDGAPYGEVWNGGDLLYFDPSAAGSWTNVQPTAPALKEPVAVVLYATSGNSGSLFVRMGVNSALGDLRTVELTSESNGDLIHYVSANSRWENFSGASGSFTTADSKTVTVTNGVITSII